MVDEQEVTDRKRIKNPNFLSATRVLKRMEKIERIEGDIGLQEQETNILYKDVLTAIATGNCTNPRAMARLAVSVNSLPNGKQE